MSDFLFQYHELEPATWVYLSSLLMIGLFFKFGRLLSVRNLDLILLILLAPGLLMVLEGQARLADARQSLAKMSAASVGGGVMSPAADPNSPAGSISSPVGPGNDREGTEAGGEEKAGHRDSHAASAETVRDAVEPKGQPTPQTGSAELSAADLETHALETHALEEPSREGVEALSATAHSARSTEVYGYFWLFGAGGLLLARLLLDPTMVRRPLLEPNLTVGGLTFIGCSLFIFLMANVVSEPSSPDVDPSVSEDGAATTYRIARVAPASQLGPGNTVLSKVPTGLGKSLAITSQLAIVVGMALVAYWHFGSLVMGVGAAALYLMLPYTALMTGRIEHAVPAAFLVWAILMYRRPLAAGSLLAVASGLVYYPFFLLPLWLSFYWHRGFWRFLSGYVPTVGVLAVLLALTSSSMWPDIQRMFGVWPPVVEGLTGIWNPDAGGLDGSYRLPVLVGFVVMAISFSLWPPQKNLGTLLSCSAALMVAAQFWHGYGGGMFIAWYAPLALLTIFRPNLEDRVAMAVLGEGWFARRPSLPKAA